VGRQVGGHDLEVLACASSAAASSGASALALGALPALVPANSRQATGALPGCCLPYPWLATSCGGDHRSVATWRCRPS
jgi:hypothetical protein